MKRFMLAASIATIIALSAADTAHAQRWGGSRGGRGYSGWSGGYYNPGWSYGYGYGPTYGYYGGYRSGNYYPGYTAWQTPYTYRSFSYPTYSTWTSTPYFYGNTGTYYTNPVVNTYDSGIVQASYSPPAYNSRQVFMRIFVPDPNAQLWIEGQATQQRGTDRTFVSPELSPGSTYTYTLRASWMENGVERSKEKKVNVTPGQETAINFAE